MMLPRFVFFSVVTFCFAAAIAGCTSQKEKNPSEISTVRQKALVEVKLAISKNDTRFVSVHGAAVSVPGISDGSANSLVLTHRMKPPIGVGDYIRNSLEERQQNNAVAYAQTYNTFLLKYLLDNPDQKTKSYLEKVYLEMKSLEGANARADALRAFHSAPQFLCVAGERNFGYPIGDSRTSHVDVRWLQMNAVVLRGAERARFDRILKAYVIPYNQILYQQLKKKWDREGIKDKMRL